MLAAIVGVVVLLIATVVFVDRDDDRSAAPEGPTSTEPETGDPDPTTTVPAEEIDPDEFLALVDELEQAVSEARGLPFQRDVTVELAGDDDFEARLLERFEEDVEDLERTEIAYRALGLLDPGTSLEEVLRGIYATGVLGFYDPETDELVVRGTSATPYVQQTIVHELVHALDDQHFELHRPQYDDAKDEVGTGFSAVLEGNARRIENEWISEQPAEFRERAREEEEAYGAGIDVSAFPEILLFLIAAPYQLGEIFVGRRVAEGGERAVDAALTSPPETSEQVLFPELYVERQARVEVPPPPADGEVADDGVVGALFLLGLFSGSGSGVGQTDAFRAVQGWGGDWYVTWTDGDAACIRADFVGDTPTDTDELETALAAWADERDHAEVSVVDDRVRLDSCVAGGAAQNPQA